MRNLSQLVKTVNRSPTLPNNFIFFGLNLEVLSKARPQFNSVNKIAYLPATYKANRKLIQDKLMQTYQQKRDFNGRLKIDLSASWCYQKSLVAFPIMLSHISVLFLNHSLLKDGDNMIGTILDCLTVTNGLGFIQDDNIKYVQSGGFQTIKNKKLPQFCFILLYPTFKLDW